MQDLWKENIKEFYIKQHATDHKWVECCENFFNGMDVLIMIPTKRVIEFDYKGQHYIIERTPNDTFSKTEEYKTFGVQKVVYHKFLRENVMTEEIIRRNT